MTQATRDPSRSFRRRGLWIVTVLAVLTAVGHFLTRGTDASTILPRPEAPPQPAAFSTAGHGVTLTGQLDRTAVLRGGDGRVKMELVLAADESRDAAVRVPTDFIVVLDRSGSMSGEKLRYAKASVEELIAQLLPDDRLALVAFSSDAHVVIESAAATPEARRSWRSSLAALGVGGGTNMSLGLDRALSILSRQRTSGRASRLLLISDGQANEGDSSVEGLASRARQASREEAALTTIGVGEGFHEFLMANLADAGTGNYYFLESTTALAAVFAQELEATRETVATALAVILEPAPGVRVVDAAGYPLETAGRSVTFRPGSLFAGQERRVWVTFVAPHATLGDQDLARVRLTFARDGQRHDLSFETAPRIACVEDESHFFDALDREAWARSVVEDDYNELRFRVAGHVREGRREEALQEIESYKTSNAYLNEKVQSDAVEQQLCAADDLAAEVDDAFSGADQAHKQNLLSKKKQAAAWDGRRAGSKKAPKADDHRP